jgi:transketolase
MTQESIAACEALAAEGISAELINVHTLKPLDEETILKSVRKTGRVVTAENHSLIGGLKSAVAELLIEKCPVPLSAVGVRDSFGEVGSYAALKQKFGLTAEEVANKVREVLSK